SGAVVSRWVTNNILGGVFATLALVAAILMFIPQPQRDVDVPPGEVNFSKGKAVAIAAVIGFLGGLVGQGGSFILIPLMLFVLKIPTRIALGSNLAIVFMSAMAGFAGKVSTGQVPMLPAIALVLGALPGAQIGGYASKRTRPATLRAILAGAIALAAARIWYDIITRGF
ncbi:MAG: sulfite exporter TauE/SafE family protein, partial [Anaerolineae bacterium]